MSEADIEYRGHFIDVQSYESDGKRWRPKAVVSIYHGGALHQKIVSAPIEVLFDDRGGHLLACDGEEVDRGQELVVEASFFLPVVSLGIPGA
jgi:hypothetical protein